MADTTATMQQEWVGRCYSPEQLKANRRHYPIVVALGKEAKVGLPQVSSPLPVLHVPRDGASDRVPDGNHRTPLQERASAFDVRPSNFAEEKFGEKEKGKWMKRGDFSSQTVPQEHDWLGAFQCRPPWQEVEARLRSYTRSFRSIPKNFPHHGAEARLTHQG